MERSLCINHQPALRSVRPLYGRLAWLDELRLVAILVMVIDHALLFFAPDSAWAGAVRLTVTRCAEPLFVFVLTYLTIFLKRPMKVERWCEIAVVSAITSSILSHSLGYPVADVLVSIALVAPALRFLLSANQTPSLTLLYASAALAVLPVSVAGLRFDYSPALIVHQVILARLFADRASRSYYHGAFAGLIAIVAALCLSLATGSEPSIAVFVFLFGHPLAALAIRAFSKQEDCFSTPWTRLAAMPLRVYAVHLGVFAGLALFLNQGL